MNITVYGTISFFPGQELNWEGKLLDDLFVGYNRFARPIADIHSPIEVSIALYLTKILALVR